MSSFSFILLFLLPLTSFLIHRLLNVVPRIRRSPPTKIALTAIFLSILFSLTGIYYLEQSAGQFPMWPILYGALTAPLLGHLYFQVFNLGETARRINLLVTLKKTGTLENASGYTPEHMISIRLERLRNLNQVVYQNGTYSPRLSVLTVVAIILRSLERFLYPRRKLTT